MIGRIRVIVVPLVALLLATAAGGRATPAAAAPRSWTKHVCSALVAWVTTVEQASSRTAAHGGTDARGVKRSLVKLLTGAEAATRTLQSRVRQAGAPAGPGAKPSASALRSEYAQAARTIAEADRLLRRAPTRDAGSFVAAARHAQDEFEAGLESVQTAFGAATFLDAPALVRASGSAGCGRVVADNSPGVTVSPASGPAGSDVSVAPTGVDSAATNACFGSSAFRTELLGADGARLETGEQTIAVPPDAAPGPATVRLVCYLPDSTGRRVIRGICGAFVVAGAGAPATPGRASCPPVPRVVVGQAVIDVESSLSEGFNPVLSALGG